MRILHLTRLLVVASAVVVLSAMAAAPPLQAAVLGQWRFAEASGQRAIDDGPFGLDGRLGASAAADADDPLRISGIRDGAMRFANGSFIRLPDEPDLTPAHVTVEAVLRATASPGRYRYVVSRGGWKCFSGAFGLYTGSGGGISFYVFDGERYAVSPAARVSDVWNGDWHHVAGVYDGRVVSLYVDGRRVGEPTPHETSIDYHLASSATAFGNYMGACDLPFTGDVDLVRFDDAALSGDVLAEASEAALRRPASPAPLPSDPVPPPFSAPVPSGRPRVTVPGAPARACRLTVSPRRIAAARRTTLRVSVAIRDEPAAGLRVRASRRGRIVAHARTRADGKARLRLRAPRRGRLRVRVAVHPKCRTGVVRIRR